MIFDDSSLDGTSQRLQKYIDRGIVEQINVSRPDGRLANEEERMLYMETCIAKFATAVEDEESNEGNWKPDWLILARPDEYYFANEPDSTLAEALKVSTAAHECVQVICRTLLDMYFFCFRYWVLTFLCPLQNMYIYIYIYTLGLHRSP